MQHEERHKYQGAGCEGLGVCERRLPGNFYFYDAAAIGMQVFDLRQAKAAGGGQPK